MATCACAAAPRHMSIPATTIRTSRWCTDERGGMRFEARLRAIARDGRTRVDGDGLHVEGASEVLLLLAAATSFSGFDKSPVRDGRDEAAVVAQQLAAAAKASWEDLRRAHLSDYQRADGARRPSTSARRPRKPTCRPTSASRRWARRTRNSSELLFHYGRYLLIASSRPGTQPANLQGIWNDQMRPPWSSNYTININTEMNYWPAESANLAELHEPMLSFVARSVGHRREDRVRQLRCTRLGGAPQRGSVAAVGASRQLRRRRPGVGALDDGGTVAVAAPVGALRLRRR